MVTRFEYRQVASRRGAGASPRGIAACVASEWRGAATRVIALPIILVLVVGVIYLLVASRPVPLDAHACSGRKQYPKIKAQLDGRRIRIDDEVYGGGEEAKESYPRSNSSKDLKRYHISFSGISRLYRLVGYLVYISCISRVYLVYISFISRLWVHGGELSNQRSENSYVG